MPINRILVLCVLALIDYPGPIFDSWAELGPFLKAMNTSYINELQEKVATWYKSFKYKYKSEIARRINTALLPKSPPKLEFINDPNSRSSDCCTEQKQLIVDLKDEVARLTSRVRVMEYQLSKIFP